MRQNIFVLGLDDLNRSTLELLPGADRYVFHPLLSTDELQTGMVSVPALLEKATAELDAFEGEIHAVVGYWDFPVSLMVPILCQRFGLRCVDLTAVVKCEHKYWSRLEQQKVIDEVPAFGLLDLDAPRAALPPGLQYPVWAKPVKSVSSEGAHRVRDDEELQEAVELLRTEVDRLGVPFNELLETLRLPPEIAEIGGRACIVEDEAAGHQLTVEGFSRNGEVRIYGVVDSLHYPGTSSFLRYEYPSALPADVCRRVSEVSRRVITGIGLMGTTFNIEFFWEAETDRLRLLEINPRHSQSHALLFQMVDGVSNHAFMLDLALGTEPHLPQGEGPYAVAAKWFLRHFTDGVVRRVPSPEEVAAVEQAVPGTVVRPTVEVGTRLSTGHGT
ncbi:ATP-grasp domain-containing protein, partial [Georgenia sp. 10Sc9-8]|nr:ATP-grasp domain-containing protein [Georgenia halotolerans]